MDRGAEPSSLRHWRPTLWYDKVSCTYARSHAGRAWVSLLPQSCQHFYSSLPSFFSFGNNTVGSNVEANDLSDISACSFRRSVVYFFYTPTQWVREKRRIQMSAEKQDVLKRLNYIDGHLNGIRKMI